MTSFTERNRIWDKTFNIGHVNFEDPPRGGVSLDCIDLELNREMIAGDRDFISLKGAVE